MRKSMAFMLVCLVLVFCTAGCKAPEKPPLTEPSRNDGPILSTPTQTEPIKALPTPVYVSVFGDTMILATYPVETWGEDKYGQPVEPDCPIIPAHQGGRLSCGGSHELETPITKVIILDAIAPQSTKEWFKGMGSLAQIQGIEKLDVQFVESMEDMFEGCGSLRELPQWYDGE